LKYIENVDGMGEGDVYLSGVTPKDCVFRVGQVYQVIFRGLAQMFCDDVMGVCWAKDVAHDQGILRKLITGLLGSGAVAEHKTESGRVMDILGLVVDLDLLSVGIAQKNLYKALYGFMSVDVEKPVAFRKMEQLSSWGSRYGLICMHMNPLVRVLYATMKVRRKHKPWLLDKESQGGDMVLQGYVSPDPC
jgi:hypothetical protein